MRLPLRTLPLVALVAGGCLAAPKWAAPEAATAPAVNRADAALDRAADCFSRRDEAGAVPHLSAYLALCPDSHPTRFQLAEILYRHGEPDRAEAEFARYLASAPASGDARRAQCHARLATLAEARGDAFAEHLHRGAGLLRLVEKWDADPARRDDRAAEPALAQALGELNRALERQPGDARANLYAALVLTRLNQHAAAARRLAAARDGLPDLALSEAEHDAILATINY